MNNLALQVRGPNLRPARNRAAAMEGRNAMMANRLNHMKLMEAEDAMAQKSQIRNALAQKPNASYEEMAGIHRQAGDVQGALAIDKAALDWQTGRSNLQKADSERFKNQLEIFGQVADNIVDDRTKQQAVGQMLEAGVISEDRAKQLWTTPYSPELVEGWKRGALTAKDRISQDFQNEKFEYQKGQDATTNARESRRDQFNESKAAFDQRMKLRDSDLSADMNELKRRELELKVGEKEQEINDAEKAKADSQALLTEAYSITKRLLETNVDGLHAASGPVAQWTPTLSDATANAEADVERIRAILTKDNLALLSGVMSDSDIRFLGNIAAGGLNLKQGDKKVEEELRAVLKRLEQYAPKEELTNEGTPKVMKFDAQGNLVS